VDVEKSINMSKRCDVDGCNAWEFKSRKCRIHYKEEEKKDTAEQSFLKSTSSTSLIVPDSKLQASTSSVTKPRGSVGLRVDTTPTGGGNTQPVSPRENVSQSQSVNTSRRSSGSSTTSPSSTSYPSSSSSSTSLSSLSRPSSPTPTSPGGRRLNKSEDTGYTGNKEGWMMKKADRRMGFKKNKWNRRWFRLAEGNLTYFESKPNEKKAAPKKSISLNGYMTTLLEDPQHLKALGKEGELCLFKLHHRTDPAPEYFFCCDTEQDMEDWIKCIMLEMFREDAVMHEAPPTSKPQKPIFKVLEPTQGLNKDATKFQVELGVEDDEIQKLLKKKQEKETFRQKLLKEMEAEDAEIEKLQREKKEKERVRQQLEQSNQTNKLDNSPQKKEQTEKEKKEQIEKEKKEKEKEEKQIQRKKNQQIEKVH